MCGGSPDKAQKEAQAAEDQRRASVTAAQQQIEGIYSSPQRGADIADLVAATKSFLGGDLSRKNEIAQRGLKFALARSGQTMGSLEVDKRRDLGQEYLRGALEVNRRGDAAGSALRQSDQQSKLDLFSQAAAGLDATTAARNAGESMRANIGLARADATQNGIGDLFGSFADIYKNSRDQRGRDDAEKYQYGGGTYYAPNQYFSSAGR